MNEQDVRAIYDYASDPDVSRWTLWEPHRNPEDTLEFIRSYVFPSYEKMEPEPLGIELKDDPALAGRVIGTVGCFRVGSKASQHVMELAYALGKPYWGKGIAAEASRGLIQWIFSTLSEVTRIQAHCKLENAPSAKVMEKVGMTFEGVHRSAVFHRNRHWDIKMYALLRSEWQTG